MNSGTGTQFWLEKRERADLLSQPIRGFFGVTIAFGIFWVLWYVFMNTQEGILRWYTPLYGFMYISLVLLVAIWQVYVLNYWPISHEWLERTHPLLKAGFLVAINIVAVGALVWGLFYNVLGVLALPYLSWPVLEKLGVYSYVAREYSSQAILMVATISVCVSPLWMVCFQNHPWQGLKRSETAFSVGTVAILLTTWIFMLTLHAHFHVLFYPWQKFAAAFPWWFEFASTLSGNFILGLVICLTVSVWLFETIWERYPFRLIKSQPLSGIAGLACIATVGAFFFATFLFLQEVAWGKAVMGATRILAPDWRYLHAGELAATILVAATILDTYFDRWPTQYSPEVNIALRTAVSFMGAALFHFLFYKFSPLILSTQAGYSHPSQFPMAPFILFIIVMLFHNWFADCWPGKTIRREPIRSESRAPARIT